MLELLFGNELPFKGEPPIEPQLRKGDVGVQKPRRRALTALGFQKPLEHRLAALLQGCGHYEALLAREFQRMRDQPADQLVNFGENGAENEAVGRLAVGRARGVVGGHDFFIASLVV